MSELYIKVDEHTVDIIKSLVRYSSFKQKYFAEKLGIEPSNLSAYLNGKKKMSKELCSEILELLGFDSRNPYLVINNKKITNK